MLACEHDDKLNCPDGEISASDAVWSYGQADLQNSGQSRSIRAKSCYEISTSKPSFEWSFTLGGGGVTSPPVVGKSGSIYIAGEYPGSIQGNGIRNSGIISISQNGMLNWFYPIPVFVDTKALYRLYAEAPALDEDENVIFAGWNDSVYSISKNGELNWAMNLHPKSLFASPVVDSKNRIYTAADTIFCISPLGEIIWSYALNPGSQCRQISLARRFIVCGLLNEGIIAVDYAGKMKWFLPFDFSDNFMSFGILVDENDNVIFKSTQSILVSISSTGQFRWQREFSPLFGITQMSLRGNRLYATTFQTILALDAENGAILDTIGNTDEVVSASTATLVDDRSNIIVPTLEGGIELHGQSGLIWSFVLPDADQTEPVSYLALDQNAILVITSQGSFPYQPNKYKLYKIQ